MVKQKKENNKFFVRKIQDDVSNIEKIPKEKISNSMTTGKKPFRMLWRPNNYRRKLVVKEKDNSAINLIRSTIPLKALRFGDVFLTFSEHSKLISVHNFMGVTIQYAKNCVVAIYEQRYFDNRKETYLIEADDYESFQGYLDKKKAEITKLLDDALFSFARQFNLVIPFSNPAWCRYEDWVKGDEFIDKIPRDAIIHDTVFKKVYSEGIEFKKVGDEEPTAHIKNYIKNRALEKIAPEILDAFNIFMQRIDSFEEKALNPLTEQIRLHLEVQNKTKVILDELKDTLKFGGVKMKNSFNEMPVERVERVVDANKKVYVGRIRRKYVCESCGSQNSYLGISSILCACPNCRAVHRF